MSGPLSLFPARIRFVNPDGTLTVEALRMLDLLVRRVGGTMGDQGTEVFALGEVLLAALDEMLVQAPEQLATSEVLVQQPDAATCPDELIVQPAPVSVDQVEGLGTMATQNIGANFSGSFTGKTVTVVNGIITQVV